MKAEIQITLNKAVLDPQGQAVLQALHRLGFTDAQDVRVDRRAADRPRRAADRPIPVPCREGVIAAAAAVGRQGEA